MIDRRKNKRDWSRIRLIGVACLLASIWAVLWARAYQVQVISGPDLAQKANSQYWRTCQAYGERGEISDSQGKLLAKTLRVKSVFARPKEIKDQAKTVQVLSDILSRQEKDLLKILRKKKNFVWVARKIGDKRSSQIRKANLAGIYLTEESRRYYPQGHMAGQLLGFVGLDNKGLEGLELSFDSYLAGKKKEYLVQRDASGHILYAPGQLSQLSGKDLRLTIRSDTQFHSEQALAKAVEKFRAQSGTALVLEVSTGEILAWANYPFFNPNNFKQYSPQDWRNRVVLDEFEPGSTIKPILVAAALEEGVCTYNQEYYCEQGAWAYQGEKFKDTHEYSYLPVNKIIRYSSNIGAGKIGLDLRAQTYHSYLQELGVGSKTGLPLPGESKGILRPPQAWTEIDLISASFGQGFSLNTLQLAKLYLCLANKGVMPKIQLIEKTGQCSCPGKRIFSISTAQKVLSMLEDVVEEDGTGTRARIQEIKVGGKTGTAQKSVSKKGYINEYVASFVGLFPAQNPQFLILVVVNEPEKNHYGGVVAAPAVKKVGEKMVASYDVDYNSLESERPDQAALKVQALSRKIEQQRSEERQKIDNWHKKIPNLQGISLRRALEILSDKGVIPQVKGQGMFIQKQVPEPGSRWSGTEKENWTLWLTQNN